MGSFWSEFPNIEEDLINVKNLLYENAKCSEKIIESSITELVDSGGKLLRPAFLLIAGRFGEYSAKKLYPLAAVMEMLHMATLVHDDIIDDAATRRGSRTVQSKYGKDKAVFIGDYLFSKCFILLSNTSMDNMRTISKIISKICIGEIQQYTSRYDIDSTVEQYLKRIQAKTAALFTLSFYIGAEESGCDKSICSRFKKIGYDIGMAFQIIDDILDCESNEETIGKPAGNDLKDGLYTLPVIYALQKDRNRLPELLKKDKYTDEDIREILNIVKDTGSIERSKSAAEKYTARAFKHISALPDCESKAVLTKVTEKLLTRKY